MMRGSQRLGGAALLLTSLCVFGASPSRSQSAESQQSPSPAAQTPAPPVPPPAATNGAPNASQTLGAVLRVRVNLVLVPVVVRDSSGRAVGNLRAEDFSLLDNNKPQAVTLFANDLQFIKVVVMLDESGSMVLGSEAIGVHISNRFFINAIEFASATSYWSEAADLNYRLR